MQGDLPANYKDLPVFQHIDPDLIKRCGELPKVLTREIIEGASVEVLNTEVIEGGFEKHPPIDPAGPPESSATLFFRARAKMDYIYTTYTSNHTMQSREKNKTGETVTLLLYWNTEKSAWMHFSECSAEEKIDSLQMNKKALAKTFFWLRPLYLLAAS